MATFAEAFLNVTLEFPFRFAMAGRLGMHSQFNVAKWRFIIVQLGNFIQYITVCG